MKADIAMHRILFEAKSQVIIARNCHFSIGKLMIPYFHSKSKHDVLVKACSPPKMATFTRPYELLGFYYSFLKAKGGSRGAFKPP